jgi:hypothetical protein
MIIQGLTLEGGLELKYVAPPPGFQGSNYGYAFSNSSPTLLGIEKFSLASDQNSTLHSTGGGKTPSSNATGQRSDTHGYAMLSRYPFGGIGIDKFPFAHGTDSQVSLNINRHDGVGITSAQAGYQAGSFSPSWTEKDILKFLFVSDNTSTISGDLLVPNTINSIAGVNSTEAGYIMGGYKDPFPSNPKRTDGIEKFSFVTDGNTTGVGTLSAAKNFGGGVSSTTHGYYVAGYADQAPYSDIEKFSFASDGATSYVGWPVITAQKPNGSTSQFAASSSTESGYLAGGQGDVPGNASPGANSTKWAIQKFPYATDSDTTDVGDLLQSRGGATGTQS